MSENVWHLPLRVIKLEIHRHSNDMRGSSEREVGQVSEAFAVSSFRTNVKEKT